MALRPGYSLPPIGSSGAPIMERGIFTGVPGARALSCVSPNLSDRTTWYQKSVKVTGETLADSGDNLTFTSANPWWIDAMNAKLTYSYHQVFKRDGTYGYQTDWLASVSVNGVMQTSGFTIDYAAGTVTFAAPQAGNTVTATYWTNNNVAQPSEWILSPPGGHKYTIECVELQYSMNIPDTMDTIRFEIWGGGTLAQYQGNLAPGTVVASGATAALPGLAPAISTTTSAPFTQPAAGATVTVTVTSTAGMAAGMPLFITGGGFYGVGAVVNGTTLVLQNLGYGNFDQSVYNLGFGQFRADYRSLWDIINTTNNQSSVVIPKHGPMTADLFIAPFNYTQATLIDTAKGAMLRLCLVNDTPVPLVDLATATFYMQLF